MLGKMRESHPSAFLVAWSYLGQVYPLFFRDPGMSNGSIAAP